MHISEAEAERRPQTGGTSQSTRFSGGCIAPNKTAHVVLIDVSVAYDIIY